MEPPPITLDKWCLHGPMSYRKCISKCHLDCIRSFVGRLHMDSPADICRIMVACARQGVPWPLRAEIMSLFRLHGYNTDTGRNSNMIYMRMWRCNIRIPTRYLDLFLPTTPSLRALCFEHIACMYMCDDMEARKLMRHGLWSAQVTNDSLKQYRDEIIASRSSCRRAIVAALGCARKMRSTGMARDIRTMVGKMLWGTRFDEIWLQIHPSKIYKYLKR